MARCHTMNLYYEVEVTNMPAKDIMDWCEHNTHHLWNFVADSGPRAVRFGGRHYVMLLFSHMDDYIMFKMVWC